MGSDTRKGLEREEFGPDSIEKAMRERIRETIEALVEEELEIALGAARSERIGSRHEGRSSECSEFEVRGESRRLECREETT